MIKKFFLFILLPVFVLFSFVLAQYTQEVQVQIF